MSRRLALMLDLDDVDALVREQRRAASRARRAGRARACARRGSGPATREPVTHDRDQQRRVDVAAGEHAARPARCRRPCRASSAATPTAPAPSTTSFVRSSRSTIASADLLVGDRDDVVEHVVEDRHRQLARLLHRDPVRDRVARPAGACRRLHADDAHARLAPRAARARCRTRARRRRPGSSTVSTLGHLLGELEPDRPLPGDHRPDPRTDGRTSRRVSATYARAASSALLERRPRRARPRRRSAASPRPSPSARPAA